MQAHWKRYDRVERETRRRLEKEAEEQRKMDVEFMEVYFFTNEISLDVTFPLVFLFYAPFPTSG